MDLENSESESNLKKLQIARRNYKTQLTKFKTYIEKEKLLENPNITQIEIRLSKVEPILDSFLEVQTNIECLDDSVDQISLENERTEFEDNYFNVVSETKILLDRFCKQDDSASLPASGSSNSASSRRTQQLNVKLPPISLPHFDGSFDQWLFFKDTFESLIHNEQSIPDINKFHYLRLSLKGQAADLLKSLEISSNNYHVAWNLLVERYENKPLLRKNHIKALFELKPVSKECHVELRNILDGMNRHLRALQVLGQPVDSWDALVIHLFSMKLDATTRREWECEYAKHEDITRETFSNFLSEKCRILETLNPQNKLKNTVRSLVTNHTPTCNFCQKDHTIYNCKTFLNLDAYSRLQEARKLKLCINCLRNNHSTNQCRSTPCRKCENKHNTLLHFSFNKNSNNSQNNCQKANESQVQNNANSNVASLAENSENRESTTNSFISGKTCTNSVLLSTALVDIADCQGNMHSCRVLLDSGSESSFITESLCNKLNLNTKTINCSVSGIGQKSTNILKQTNVTIHARQVSFKINLKCLIIPKITNKIPATSVSRSHLKIPPNIILADPAFNEPGSIDVLIGADNFWDLIMIGQIKLGKHLPTLQKTQLGWIVSGNVYPSYSIKSSDHSVACYLSILDQSLDSQISKFWEIEEINAVKPLSSDDSFCEELFQKTTIRDAHGRFIVNLPLKQPASCLGDSREIAMKCFFNLEKRLTKNPKLKTDYTNFLNEYESLGHMTQINTDNLSEKSCFYLPHHGVLKESSTTTKLRVVFNGSKTTSSGLSLNDILRVGPTVQEDLFSIVLRARKHNIMLTGDITKMYRQILVNDSQRSLQLILWRSNPNSEIQTYQLNTVTYGTAPAAFLSTRCLKELSNQYKDIYPEICKIIAKDFYVDDLCTGCSSVEEAKYIKQKLSEILDSAGFPLRKFMCNIPEVISNFSENTDTILQFGESCENKTLGLLWNSQSDTLQYSIKTFNDSNATKRKILSCVSQIFDPLGLLQPVIIIAKCIIQKLWQYKLNWDESIPLNLYTTWMKFQTQLQDLNKLEIPRHVLSQNPIYIELHGFSDASEMAYGACMYIRTIDVSGTYLCHLLCSKTRVCPLKTITIPRLELCAALLLAELSEKVKRSLDLSIDQCFYWCDSTITLSWIKSKPAQWKIFVANRVAQIQSITDIDSWKYINTHENPADLLSRGLNPKNLINSELWWKGPSWLSSSEDQWPVDITNFPHSTDIDLPEIRPQKTLAFTTTSDPFNLIDKFSSFNKLQRVTAYCCRFIQNCLTSKASRKSGPLQVDELNHSLSKLVKIVQMQEFSHEYQNLSKSKQLNSKSKILRLNPFLDQDGLIRVGGRLKHSQFDFKKKHPLILPGKHRLSKLIAKQEHLRLLHAGPQLLLASIRDRFWPTSGRNLVKEVVRQCLRCFRFSATPTSYLMGDLPKCRVTPERPFYNVGIDFCGPFLLKDRFTRNYKLIKAYICLFVCLSTRAMHLELVSNLSTAAFIAALRRFFSRRGLSANMFSDHGTNFVGAKNEIYNFLFQHKTEIHSAFSSENIKWHFIPPRAPHFGGIWEAGVKSTKFHLKRVLNQTPLSYEEFLTIIHQVEACLNSRPLFPFSNDPNDPQSLTPAHFLIGQRLTALPDHDYTEVRENTLNKFHRVQKIVQCFWKRWSKEFISELQQRSKWKKNYPELLKLGTMVLVKEDGMPPLTWKIGIVETIHPGPDGITRAVTIRSGSAIYKRPVAKICILPEDR